jgi:exodeoxyribonuclease VII large subunit
MMPPTEQVIGVSEFLGIVNETMSFAYPAVTVEGEVSGFQIRQNKWVFFDLKEKDATMNCFMSVYQLKVAIEDGMKVQVTGSPKVTQWGKFSFTARNVTPSGEGALKRAYELLKARLQQEGLFDVERKRPIPVFPDRIGLITAPGSDAYTDFMDRLSQRWGGVTIVLAEVAVQGSSAPEQISNAIAQFNQASPAVDVVVLTRGGGSLEDLQAFNNEAVVRAVASSRAPIIVGVGHEANTSLADLAADARAATPTAAAILVVPDRVEIAAKLETMEGGWGRCLAHLQEKVSSMLERHINTLQRSIEMPMIRLERAQLVLAASFARLNQDWGSRIASAKQRQSTAMRILAVRFSQRTEALERLITTLNPRSVLARGYSIARLDGHIIKSADEAAKGDSLMIELHEGKLRTTVEDV